MSFLVIGLTFAHVALNRINIWRIPLVKPYALFVGVALLGVALAPDKNRALDDWLRIVGVLSLYILVVDLMRLPMTSVDAPRAAPVVGDPAGFGVYQFATNTGNHETEGLNRIEGTFVHPRRTLRISSRSYRSQSSTCYIRAPASDASR